MSRSDDQNISRAKSAALNRRHILLAGATIAAAGAGAAPAQAQQPQPSAAGALPGRKPNILVIWGDDIGL